MAPNTLKICFHAKQLPSINRVDSKVLKKDKKQTFDIFYRFRKFFTKTLGASPLKQIIF